MHEKGIAFERVEVDLPASEQRSPEFLAINPLGLVPVYADDNGIHCDSLVIMQYLEDQYPEPRLFSSDANQLQESLDWIAYSSEEVRNVSHHLYWQLIEPPESGIDVVAVADLKRRGLAVLTRLESVLSSSSYIMEHHSVVDIAMLPWIYGYQRFDFPFVEQFPGVFAWLTALSSRPSFQENYHQVGRPFFDDSP